MSDDKPDAIVLEPGRFSRLEAIEWWDQSRLRDARVLVAGAGALGNEVIKNLSLLGIGNLVIIDMDRVERSNLSRSVLFREEDEGKPKSECAAQGARSIFKDIHVEAMMGNILCDLGLGYFRWADVVVGALDNREARVFVNSACARVGRPWIDGGIEVLQGIVRGFAPPDTACYECTMSRVDWDLLNKRRSCSLLARRALLGRGTPTTPTIASIIAGIQTQEVVKLLHGMEALTGKGFVFEGKSHSSHTVAYPVSPECGWHDEVPQIEAPADLNSDSRLREIWDRASVHLGGLDAIDLSREMVDYLECPSCCNRERVLQSVEKIRDDEVVCSCGSERSPHFFHSITGASDLLEMTVSDVGLPRWDILWARRGEKVIGIEITGDRTV